MNVKEVVVVALTNQITKLRSGKEENIRMLIQLGQGFLFSL